jgi:hypothetical protein
MKRSWSPLVSLRGRLIGHIDRPCSRVTPQKVTWCRPYTAGDYLPRVPTNSTPLSSPSWSRSKQSLFLLPTHTLLSSVHRTKMPHSPLCLQTSCSATQRRRATRRSSWAEHLFLEPPEPSSASQAEPRRDPRLSHAAWLPHPRCLTDGSPPPAIPWFTNTSRSVGRVPRTSTALKSLPATTGTASDRRSTLLELPPLWTAPHNECSSSLILQIMSSPHRNSPCCHLHRSSPPGRQQRPGCRRQALGARLPYFLAMGWKARWA